MYEGQLWLVALLHRANEERASPLPWCLGFSKNLRRPLFGTAREGLVELRTQPERGAAATFFMPLTTILLPIVALPLTVWKNLLRLKNTKILNMPRNDQKIYRISQTAKTVKLLKNITKSGCFRDRNLWSRTLVGQSLLLSTPGGFRSSFLYRDGLGA